jgi:hypothetical protein
MVTPRILLMGMWFSPRFRAVVARSDAGANAGDMRRGWLLMRVRH